MVRVFIGILLMIGTAAFPLMAQTQPDTTTPAYNGSTSVAYSPKSRFFSASYRNILGFPITSNSHINGISDGSGKVKKLEDIVLKLNVPFLLKPRLKGIVQFKYAYEEYNFEQPEMLTDDIYNNLEQHHLNRLKATLLISKSMGAKWWLAARLGGELNGDYRKRDEEPITKYTKLNAAIITGRKSSLYTSYGLGIYLSYDFGKPTIYPAVLLNHTFNQHVGFEGLLPASASVWYKFNEKTQLVAEVGLDGSSYHIVIDNPPLSDISTLELRRSDIMGSLSFQREIYDFLWFNADIGYRFHLKFDVAESNEFKANEIIENTIKNSPFFRIGIFLVPPRRLTSKYIKEVE